MADKKENKNTNSPAKKIADQEGAEKPANRAALSPITGDERYRRLFQNASLGIFHSTLDGRYIDVNPALARMLGYDSPELVISSITNIAEQVYADPPKRDAVARHVLDSGGTLTTENRYLRKDGTIWHGLLHLSVIKDEHGQPQHYEGFVEDITERKRAEETLQKKEEQFRLLVENAPYAIYVQTRGQFVYINKFALGLLGAMSPDQLLGKPIMDRIHPDCHAAVRERIKSLNGEGENVPPLEEKYLRLDGTPIDVEVSAVSFTYENHNGVLVFFHDITERKKAEENIRQSEERFRTIFELGPLGMTIVSPDYRLMRVNKAFCAMLGYAEEELVGRAVEDITFSEDIEPSKKLSRRLLDGETSRFRLEKRFIKKDGDIIWVNLTTTVVHSEEGKLIYGLGMIEEITERRRREERLKKINTAILKLDEHDHPGNLNVMTSLCGELLAADCALYNRLDGNLLCVTGQWAGPSDLKKEDSPQGHICFDVINRDSDVPLVVKNLGNTVYAKTDPNVAAYGLKTYIGCRVRYGGIPRGSLCVVYARDYEPSPDDLDVISIIASAVAQEEERYAALQKLQRSEQFIRNILDTVDEGFIVVDRDYRILTANKAYCEQAGECEKEIIGRHCYEVSHERCRPCYDEGEDCAVRHVFETGEPYTSLHKHKDAKGSILYVETKAFAIKDSTGNVTSAIETINNITEKHLLEEERLKTQKLESIGTLAGGIAHDFNNLLQGIFGYISMAKLNFGQKDNALAMLEQAENALQRSVNLTTQLLTFAKGGKPVKKLIDLRPVIENSTKFALSGSRSEFRMNIPDDLWQAEADEGQVGQVIQNIVLNADQAMPMSGAVIVTATNVAEGDTLLPPNLARGNYVMISIQDSGIGIPEQYIGRIFDPYFTTKEKGSGLGLATSYSIVRNHGGMIDLRTKPGEGSTFMIYLPAIAGKRRTASAARPAEPSLKCARVLVMDDEEFIRKLSADLLGELGQEVEVAKHGQEAIEKYQEATAAGKPFAVVILDLTVRGGMGGVETVQRLLEIDPAVKAIVSSGYSDDAAMADCLAHGFKAYLKKPYNIQLLRDTLGSLL